MERLLLVWDEVDEYVSWGRHLAAGVASDLADLYRGVNAQAAAARVGLRSLLIQSWAAPREGLPPPDRA